LALKWPLLWLKYAKLDGWFAVPCGLCVGVSRPVTSLFWFHSPAGVVMCVLCVMCAVLCVV